MGDAVGSSTILASAANQKQTKKATTNKTGQLKLLPPSLLTSRKFLCTGHTLQSRAREKERNGAREERASERSKRQLEFYKQSFIYYLWLSIH